MGDDCVFYSGPSVGGSMNLMGKTRSEICATCEHRHDFTIAGTDDDVFLCKLRYISTCSMKRALADKTATCPHPDRMIAAAWDAATVDAMSGCGHSEPLTPEQQERATASRVKSKAGLIGPQQERRGMVPPTFKVYQ